MKRLFFLSVFVWYSLGISAQISAPNLICVQNNTNNNGIMLTWELPTVNCGPFISYQIFVSNNRTGPYNELNPITNVTQTTFTFTTANINDNDWFFYLQSNYACGTQTALSSDTLQYFRTFPTPVIKTVTVENGQSKITWETNPPIQTHQYVIHSARGAALDTVVGRTKTMYIDSIFFDPTIESIPYKIFAQDQCGGSNGGTSDFSNIHRTIFLQQNTDRCRGIISYKWNAYQGWPDDVEGNSVAHYLLIVDNISTGQQDTMMINQNTLSFDFNQFDLGDSLCARIIGIQAANSQVSSTSNTLCVRAEKVAPPRFFFIRNITISTANQIVLTWRIDPNTKAIRGQVERSTDGINYTLLESFTPSTPIVPIDTFIDASLNPIPPRLFYRISIIDSCNVIHTSDIASPISLSATQADFFENTLQWTALGIDSISASPYSIWQKVNDTTFSLLGTSNQRTFSDNLESNINEQGQFCYTVSRLFTLNRSGFIETHTSRSNLSCVNARPRVYIPNAFAPNGINNIFKPVIIFTDLSNYSLRIFNRLGERVFESHNIDNGWNGKDRKGKDSPEGGYAYTISYKASNGIEVTRQGMLILIR